MIESVQLLHNMSTPPKSVVQYTGLDGATTTVHRGGGGSSPRHNVYGNFVTFCLPRDIFGRAAHSILKTIGVEPGPTPEKILLALIERRARELPVPDACVVRPPLLHHPRPWPDTLAALAIITKSSTNVWLRSKTPRLSAVNGRAAVSLLIPPACAARIEELSK